MSKKKIIGLIVIIALIAIVIWSVFKGREKALNTDSVSFTFRDQQSNQMVTLGWMSYVDKFYTTPGAKASEKVAIKIATIKSNESWVASIKRTAPNWGLTPEKFLVRHAILDAVDLNMIVPNAGIAVPDLKNSITPTQKYGPFPETLDYQFA